MERNFQKLKNRLRAAAITKCIVSAVASGIIAAAAYVLVCKAMILPLDLLIGAEIALAVAVAIFVVAMLIIRPTEKRLAKILDEKLSLGEKVQTMIAFRADSSNMVQIQREDTDRILGSADKKLLRSRGAWVNVLLPVLATALAVTAYAIPARSITPDLPAEEEIEVELWALEEWQIVRVRSLIEKVKGSDMADEGKQGIVNVLEGLLVTLEPVSSKAQMKTEVMDAMVSINGITDGINTYTSVIRSLRASSNAKVSELADAIGTPSDPIVESKYLALRSSFTQDNFDTEFVNFSRELAIALAGMTLPADDGLYIALSALSESLSELAESDIELFDSELISGLAEIFEGSAEGISLALAAQNVNREVSDSTNRELMDIFGIEWSELPDELKSPDNDEAGTVGGDYEDKEDDELKGDSGGLGGGEVLYGSNDAVYDPDEQKKVSYGEVIDKYDGKKTAELDERALTDDIREWIDDYFADLYYSEENKD